jgi:hypothetical protein
MRHRASKTPGSRVRVNIHARKMSLANCVENVISNLILSRHDGVMSIVYSMCYSYYISLGTDYRSARVQRLPEVGTLILDIAIYYHSDLFTII